MKGLIASLLVSAFTLFSPCFAEELNLNLIGLNNDGVKDLNAKKYPAAIEKFEAALKIDPKYRLALDNLAIAHREYGKYLRIQGKKAEGLKELHIAAFCHPNWKADISEAIQKDGQDPRNFEYRVDLAEKALSEKDNISAAVEFEEALSIKDDPQIHQKLVEIYESMADKSCAEKQYLKHLIAVGRKAEALKVMHESAYKNPDWNADISEAIRNAGKDPRNFRYRKELAEKALLEKDNYTAAVEFEAALSIKNDPQTHKELADLYESMGEKEKAKNQIEKQKQIEFWNSHIRK
jgi:Tfp pilus assembly protein PilF